MCLIHVLQQRGHNPACNRLHCNYGTEGCVWGTLFGRGRRVWGTLFSPFIYWGDLILNNVLLYRNHVMKFISPIYGDQNSTHPLMVLGTLRKLGWVCLLRGLIIHLTHVNVWESMGKPCSCMQLIKSRIIYCKSCENPYQYYKSREIPYQVLQVARCI